MNGACESCLIHSCTMSSHWRSFFVTSDSFVCHSVDFNVPLKDGKVTDPLRINEALPTIRYVLEKGAKSVVLMSHLGRPDGKANKKYSMAPVVPVLEEKLGRKV